MGHKVNPIGMRLQVNRTWDSRWYADTKEFGDLLLEDHEDQARSSSKECKQAGVIARSSSNGRIANAG
jgi:small subunit ribosomal protein S3